MCQSLGLAYGVAWSWPLIRDDDAVSRRREASVPSLLSPHSRIPPALRSASSKKHITLAAPWQCPRQNSFMD